MVCRSSLQPVANDNKQKLFAFARYEDYDTHAETEGSLVENPAYDRNDVTMGLSYHIAPGVVFKGDYQIKDNAVEGADAKNQLNFGSWGLVLNKNISVSRSGEPVITRLLAYNLPFQIIIK